MDCPCQSQNSFAECCEPILSGSLASTAEILMRARYTAYTRADMGFIEKTQNPKTRKKTDMKANQKWALDSKWMGLKIISTQKGLEKDTTGVVEFEARYDSGTGKKTHHEISEFVKIKDRWYFSNGRVIKEEPVTSQKVGRNEPCPCGSGKKYKKCCASQ